jgi:hypothetical protein
MNNDKSPAGDSKIYVDTMITFNSSNSKIYKRDSRLLAVTKNDPEYKIDESAVYEIPSLLLPL